MNKTPLMDKRPLTDKPSQPLPERLAWFVALWLGGVAAVSLLAYAIKWGMGLA